MPSFSSEPKAMYSANAQSTVRFLVMSARPRRMRERPVGRGPEEHRSRASGLDDRSTRALAGVLSEKAKAVGGPWGLSCLTCSQTRADLGFLTEEEAVMYWVRVLYNNPMRTVPAFLKKGLRLIPHTQ